MNTQRSTTKTLAVAGVAAVLAVGGFAATQIGQDDDAAATSGAATTSAPATPAPGAESGQSAPAGRYPSSPQDNVARDLERRDPQDPMAQGDPQAPVVMIIYSDFQCPFCRTWALETKPELQELIDDGTLRLEWRDFPYLGPESTLAAMAGRVAAEQDTFWEFHDVVFAQDFSPNSGAVTQESLQEWAAEAGLDTEAFADGVNQADRQELVFADRDEGLNLGVTGTPAFLVNGVPIIGAQPSETFVQAVEDAAAAATGE